MWESGDSLSLVTDALSGLQDLRPNLRGSLAWRLVKTWQRIEIPQRAPQLDCAVLSLGFTKTSQRAGAADSVTTRVESLCRRFFVWKSQAISLETNLFKNRTTFSARALTHALPHWTFIRGVLDRIACVVVEPQCTLPGILKWIGSVRWVGGPQTGRFAFM